MENESRELNVSMKDRIVGSAIVLIVALAARLLHLSAISALPSFGYLTYDLLHFNNIAIAILKGQQLGHEAVFKAPFYSMVLAELYSLIGGQLFQTLLVQCVLGSLSCVLIYLTAIHFYSQKVGMTAGLISALYGTFIVFDAELLPVTLTIFLLLAALYTLLQYQEKHRMWWLVCSGIAVALSGASTPETLILVPVGAWWIYRETGHNWKIRTSRATAFVLVAFLITTLFALRNSSLGGEKIPYLTDVGLRLAAANQANATGRTVTLPNSGRDLGLSYSSAVDATLRTNGRELEITDMGSFWLSYALKSIANDPIKWVTLEMRKFVDLISGCEIATDRPIYYFAQGNFPLNILLSEGIIFLPFGIILPLALLAPLAVRNSNGRPDLIVMSAISLAPVAILFNVFAFQRLLIVPSVIIWAAAGLWGIIDLYRRQEYSRFYRWLSVLVMAVIVVNGVSRIPGLSRSIDSKFEGKMFVANSLLAANRLDEASLEYQSASRIDPKSPRPYNSIAGIYARQGQDSLAIVYHYRAASLDANDDRPLRGVANMLKRQQKLGDLNHLLVRVIREHPKANWAYDDYAGLHFMLNEYTQAAEIYERSFAADSTNVEAIFKKGEAYLAADMRQEAQDEFQRYLGYFPNSVAGHANLGQTFARQQRIDEARREFDFVRSHQPNNPASYFNLSTLYYQVNDLSRSSSYLDTAAALDKTFPGLSEMRQMLDSARASTL